MNPANAVIGMGLTLTVIASVKGSYGLATLCFFITFISAVLVWREHNK